jgi:hypothetical protein
MSSTRSPKPYMAYVRPTKAEKDTVDAEVQDTVYEHCILTLGRSSSEGSDSQIASQRRVAQVAAELVKDDTAAVDEELERYEGFKQRRDLSAALLSVAQVGGLRMRMLAIEYDAKLSSLKHINVGVSTLGYFLASLTKGGAKDTRKHLAPDPTGVRAMLYARQGNLLVDELTIDESQEFNVYELAAAATKLTPKGQLRLLGDFRQRYSVDVNHRTSGAEWGSSPRGEWVQAPRIVGAADVAANTAGVIESYESMRCGATLCTFLVGMLPDVCDGLKSAKSPDKDTVVSVVYLKNTTDVCDCYRVGAGHVHVPSFLGIVQEIWWKLQSFPSDEVLVLFYLNKPLGS